MAKFFAWLLLIANIAAFIASFYAERQMLEYETQLAQMQQPCPMFKDLQFCNAGDSPDD